MIPTTDRRMAAARTSASWRRAAATDLLTELRLKVTPEALKALDPFIGTLQVGETRWFALRAALMRGHLAGEEAITEQMTRWRQLLIDYAMEYRAGAEMTPHKWAKRILARRGVDKYGTVFPCKPLHSVIWLDMFGRDTSPASINAIKKLVPDDFDPDSAMGRAWVWLVEAGHDPTPQAVDARLRELAAARAGRGRLRGFEAWLEHSGTASQVVAWIEEFVAAHGTGPLWREVGAHMGWNSWQTERVLHALRRHGRVSFTEQPGSLRAIQASQALTIPSQMHTDATPTASSNTAAATPRDSPHRR